MRALGKFGDTAAVAEDARAAHAAGRAVFAAYLIPSSRVVMGQSSGQAPGIGEMIEAVEAAGWVLAFAPSAAVFDGGRLALYCVFRRG